MESWFAFLLRRLDSEDPDPLQGTGDGPAALHVWNALLDEFRNWFGEEFRDRLEQGDLSVLRIKMHAEEVLRRGPFGSDPRSERYLSGDRRLPEDFGLMQKTFREFCAHWDNPPGRLLFVPLLHCVLGGDGPYTVDDYAFVLKPVEQWRDKESVQSLLDEWFEARDRHPIAFEGSEPLGDPLDWLFCTTVLASRRGNPDEAIQAIIECWRILLEHVTGAGLSPEKAARLARSAADCATVGELRGLVHLLTRELREPGEGRLLNLLIGTLE